METVLAGRNDGSLELQDGFVAQTCSVRHIASRAADGGYKPFIRIQDEGELVDQAGHGYRSLASDTSHASRQSGQ